MYNQPFQQQAHVNNNQHVNSYIPSLGTNGPNSDNYNANINDMTSSQFFLPPSQPSHPPLPPQRNQVIYAIPHTPPLLVGNNSNNLDIPNINSNDLNTTNRITLLNSGNIVNHDNNNSNNTLTLSISYHTSMIRNYVSKMNQHCYELEQFTFLYPGNIISHNNNDSNNTLMLSVSYHASMIRDYVSKMNQHCYELEQIFNNLGNQNY